uniref:SHSP domain-containing protein n=1 Tax=Oryzias latipes TaxID=8090 RepID=A0A3B3HZJ7_ORYLA
MFFFSPVRSLWPEVRLCSTSGSFAEELQELRSSLELMDKFQDKNLEETSLSRAVDPATMSFLQRKSAEDREETGRKGSYSYRLRSSDKTVTCCLSPDGKLHIQAKEETRNFLNSPPLLLSEYKAGTESLLRQKDTQKRKDNSTSFHLPTKRLKT